ncbi:MAG: rhodanese-like domain-containing protein [Chloroflexota bacterium]|nr:rhodanese-like domain-containing protein [Chloroflexota bacterium]
MQIRPYAADPKGPTMAQQEPFQRISVEEAEEKRQAGITLIDTRELDEYQDGHASGAPLMPHMSVMTRADELEQIAGGKDQPVMFICAKGQRSAVACEFAAALGFTDLYNVEGGTDAWIAAGLPIEHPA